MDPMIRRYTFVLLEIVLDSGCRAVGLSGCRRVPASGNRRAWACLPVVATSQAARTCFAGR